MSGLHESKRTANGGLRRDVQYHRSETGSTHTRVGNANYVGDALFQKSFRHGHPAPLGESGPALRSRVFQDKYRGPVNGQILTLQIRDHLLMVFEHPGTSG